MNATMTRDMTRPLTITLLGLLLAACASQPIPPPAPCTELCASHEDGYQWAMQGSLSDPKQCENANYPPAFTRGCLDAVNDYSQMRPASSGL